MSVRSAKPNWPEIFRAISESVEPRPTRFVGPTSKQGAWVCNLQAALHDEPSPYNERNWLSPAAAMELLKRMMLQKSFDYNKVWRKIIEQLGMNDPAVTVEEEVAKLEEAIVLATYAGLEKK